MSTGIDNLFYQLQSLSRLYSELDGKLSMILDCIYKVIQLTFSELEKIFTSKPDLSLNFVQLFPHPDCVLDLSKTIIKNRIHANTNKKITTITAEKKVLQVLETVKNSYPAASYNDVLCDQLKLYVRRY